MTIERKGMREISIHVIRTDTVRMTDCSELAKRMPRRYEKAMRFRFEKDRLLCLGAGLLMMDVLNIRDEQEICSGPNGKLYVPGGQAFNLSHSGSFCILTCADTAQAQIGTDIEEMNERHLEIADHVYTKKELAWMKADADPVERFFRLWTWKESVMKATGLGMALEPKTFEVLPFTEGKPLRLMGQSWYSWEDQLENCRLSVCADEPVGQVHLTEHTG